MALTPPDPHPDRATVVIDVDAITSGQGLRLFAFSDGLTSMTAASLTIDRIG